MNGINTDYAGNYIYESNQLQFLNTPEGYAEPIDVTNYNAGFRYTYQYKDHLGNIRLSYKDLNQNTGAISLSIVEENNYYPFGLKHKRYNTAINGTHHKYMFGGKELQDEIVGSSSFEVYDFGARNYDPAIGRFIQVDPLAAEYVYNGTYNFAENNVIQFNELEGLENGIPNFYMDHGRVGQFFTGLVTWGSGASKVFEDTTDGSKAAKAEMNNYHSTIQIDQNDFNKVPVSREAADLMKEGSVQMSEALPDSQDVKAVGDGLAITGSAIVMAAPYTGPLAPKVAAVGGGIALTGTLISAGAQVYDGDNFGAGMTIGSLFLGNIAGNKVLKEMSDDVAKEFTSTVISNTAAAMERVINKDEKE